MFSFQQFHELSKEEIETGFVEPVVTVGDKWIYKVKKFTTISNITLLFRGDEEEGLLSYLDEAYLFVNGRVVDKLENMDEDPRVCEFPHFDEEYPLPSFAIDSIEIHVKFFKDPPFQKDQLRILGDVNDQPLVLNEDWKYLTQECTFVMEKGKLSIVENMCEKFEKIKDILDESESEVDDLDLDLGMAKSRLLSYDLDYYTSWKTQRKLLKRNLN